MSRRAKILVGAVLGLLALTLLSAWLYLRSAHFQRYVQGRIVRQLEQTTGGRVEMRGLRWKLSALEAELQGLVIRGLEKDAQRPLLAADNLLVRLKIISLLRREIDWRLLRLTHPLVHVTVDAAGRSNIPEPGTKPAGGRGPWDKIWELGIKRLELVQGELSWNDRRIPLDFAAENIFGELTYEMARAVYHGRLSFQTELVSPAAGTRPSLPAQMEAELRMSRTALEISRLHAATARSSLEGNGRLANLAQPKITLDYSARVDVDEFAAASNQHELHGGRARLAGWLTYDTADHSLASTGEVELEKLGLKLLMFQLGPVSGSSRFRASRERIELPNFRLFLLGGRMDGNGIVRNLGAVPEVTISGQVSGFDVATLNKTFSTRDLPLTELRWAGSVSGKTQARFQIPEKRSGIVNLAVESALAVEPPKVTPAGMLPVTGRGEVSYSQAGDRLELRNISLQTPASTISADGALGVGTRPSELRLAATSTSLQEWMPLVAAMRQAKAPVPLELQGRAEFHGFLRGAWRTPSLEGRVEAADFRYDGTQWSRFRGEIAYSRDRLRVTEAELRRDSSSARLNLVADLDRGELTHTSPLTLHAVVEKAQVGDLQALAGVSYPLTGLVDGSVDISGTRGRPQGSGFLSVTGGTLVGEPFDALRANLHFEQDAWRASEIVLKKGTAQIAGEAEYRPADKSYRFQLAGERVPLGEISRLRSERRPVSGLASFRVSGSGTLDRPALDATVRVSDLVVSGERVGSLSAVVETRNTQLTAQVESQFLQGDIRGNVSADMTGDFPARGRIEFTAVDLDPLLASAVRDRITTHSNASGFVNLSGPLKKLDSLDALAEIRDFRIALEQVDLKNAGRLRASYRNGTIQIEPAHLTGEQTDLHVSGSIRLTGPPSARALNIRADGELNMALVRTLSADLIGSGRVLLNGTASGTLQRPLLIGRAEFRNSTIALADFPTGLSEMQGAVLFDTSRAWIEKLTAVIGGGSVNLSGAVDDYATRSPVFRLRAEAQGVRLRYPEGTSSLLNANLALTGNAQRSTLSGEVAVVRGRFDQRFDLASALGLAREPPRVPVTSSLLQNLQLDVRVASSPDLRFEFSQARNLQLEANLRLRGTAARPAVLGRVNLLQGEIYFAGTQYVINRGDISFVNPFRIEPVVNLSLQTRAQQYEISIDFNGPLDRMNVSYRSDPPLPSGEIQALLVTGRAREGPYAAQTLQPLPTIGANTILAQALNATVGSRIERIFGVSRLKIDPQVGGPETNPGARVTLEQQVTPDIRFTYITNLASSQQQVIQVEWTINPRWSVMAVRDRNGLFGIDLRWRKRFR